MGAVLLGALLAGQSVLSAGAVPPTPSPTDVPAAPHGPAAQPSASASAGRPRLDSSLLRLTSPTDETLVSGGKVRVRVRARTGVKGVQASVDGRSIRLHKHGRRYQGTLAVSSLGAGLHSIVVRGKRGHTYDHDGATVIVGRQRTSLVQLQDVGAKLKSSKAYVPVQFRLKTGVRTLEVTLNGRRARDFVGPHYGRERTVNLSASDGLRRGKNRLVVRAITDQGAWDIERRTITVAKTAGLAEAGPAQRLRLGQNARLDARKSHRGRKGSHLSYAWDIVSAPKGSRDDALADTTSSRATLRPDRPGRYIVRTKVTETTSSGRRTTTEDTTQLNVTADIPPVGYPLATMTKVDGGAGTGITYNGDEYPATSATDMVMVAINRDYGTVDFSGLYDLNSEMGSLQSDIADRGSDDLIVLGGTLGENPDNIVNILSLADGLGVAAPAPLSLDNQPFSAVGIPGATLNSMFANSLGGINGYIAPSQRVTSSPKHNEGPQGEASFGFIFGDYRPFTLSSTATQATVVTGATTQTAALATGQTSGMAATVLDGHTLNPVEPLTVFDVNNSDSGTAQAAQQALAGMLTGAIEPGRLVAVQTIGSVQAATETPAWNQIVKALIPVGATQHLVNTIDGGYSLLGASGPTSPPAETSTSASGFATAQEQGVLTPDRATSVLQPLVYDGLNIGSGFDYSLLTLAYQPAQPWPHADDARYVAAYNWVQLDQNLPQPDLRTSYWDNANFAQASVLIELGNLTCPTDNPGFTQQICQDTIRELQLEVEWVGYVDNFIDNLQTPISWSTGDSYAHLEDDYSTVQSSVKAPSDGNLTSTALGVIGAGFDLASIFGGEAFEPVWGVFGGLFGMASALTGYDDGASTSSKLEKDIGGQGAALQDAYIDTLLSYNLLRNVLLSDYGKLSVAGANTKDSNSAWAWGPDATTTMINNLDNATAIWVWGQLMPEAHHIWLLPTTNPDGSPVTPQTPWNLWCTVSSDTGNEYHSLFGGTESNPASWFLADQGDGAVMWVIAEDKSSWWDNSQDFDILSKTTANAMNDIFSPDPDGNPPAPPNLLLQAQFWSRNFAPQQLSKDALGDCGG